MLVQGSNFIKNTFKIFKHIGTVIQKNFKQMKTLEKNGFVKSSLINKKNKVYILDERFFNIWYLMRYGRKRKKQEVLWLVGFLKDWCTDDELIQRANNHIRLAKSGELNQRGAYYMAEALSRTVHNAKLQYDLLFQTKTMLSTLSPEMAETLSDADTILFNRGLEAHRNKDFAKAEDCWKVLAERNNEGAMFNLALLYENKHKDYDKAEVYYKMAIEQGDSSAMFNLALLYQNKHKDYDKAEVYYKMAIEQGHSDAMYNLAMLYQYNYKDYERAKKYYQMSIEQDRIVPIYKLAFLFEYHFKKAQKAKEYFHMAIKQDFKNGNNTLLYSYSLDKKEKNQYFKLFEKYTDENDKEHLYALSIMGLNCAYYKKSLVYIKQCLDLAKSMEDFQYLITDYFVYLISQKQYQLALELFEEERFQLKKLIRPVYFALMYFMQDKYPKEYKRMGDELKETVEEIIEKIEQFRTDLS